MLLKVYDNDMHNSRITVSKKGLLIIAVLLLFVIASRYTYVQAHSNSFKNCTQAEAAGFSNIPSDAAQYNIALDRDHDGVACEQ